MNTENTIFYATANAGYAVYAATSLMTVRDYLPNARLCVLSSGLADYDKRVLDENNIEYIEQDLSDIFTMSWQYPIDCYYIFSGPEIFGKQGYDYSVYIDGDILCANNPLEGVSDVAVLAGVAATDQGGEYISIFGDDWPKIQKEWNVPSDYTKRKRINSGIVYFNNKAMIQMKLLERAGELFQVSLAREMPRKGDDSLFSLLQYVYLQEDEVQFMPAEYNFVLQFNKWIYPIENLIFFHFSIDKPWKKHPYIHNNSELKIYNPYVKMWRKKYMRIAGRSWRENTLTSLGVFDTYSSVLDFMKNLGRVSLDILLWLRGLKKSYITRRLNATKKPIPTFWWQEAQEGIVNFGDEITADIIKKIFGYTCVRASIDDCKLIGAGSIIELVADRQSKNIVYVWGSGFIQPEGPRLLDVFDFRAVRGRLSQSRVGNVAALGDPGLLANIVYRRAKVRKDKIGVVVHYIDHDLPIVDDIRFDSRFMIIDPLDSPENVAKEISSCTMILSSSLHGLIFADSFGIPNIHVQLSKRVTGGTYKFEDYYSATGREYGSAEPERIFNESYLAELKDQYKPIKNLSSIQRKLIKAFPDIW